MAETSNKATYPSTALEADPNDLGDDLDADEQSDITSLTPSVLKYREENGRKYHAYKAGAYFMPNDELEVERLDLQHNLCILTQNNKLYSSPAGRDKPLRRVLDGGTGTGIWAIEFADEHPETHVLGVDLSAIQSNFVPPNVEFLVDDLESDWAFGAPFDFVYLRMLTGSIKDFAKLFSQAYKHLTPGGYVELHDPINPITCDDGSLTDDLALVKWNRLLLEASVKLGAPLDSPLRYEHQLRDAGFINVTVIKDKWPLNSWPLDPRYKEIGTWACVNVSQGLEALSLMLFTHILGWSADEVKTLIAHVKKDMKRRDLHGYWPVYTVYGQKPEDAS